MGKGRVEEEHAEEEAEEMEEEEKEKWASVRLESKEELEEE